MSGAAKSVTKYPGRVARAVMLLVPILTVCGRPCHDGNYIYTCFYTSLANQAMQSDYNRELFSLHESAVRKRETNGTMNRIEIAPLLEDYKNVTSEDIDVVDREDHVTQFLSELLVNTDSEITGLEASDVEDAIKEDSGSDVNNRDAFFSFLTGEELFPELPLESGFS